MNDNLRKQEQVKTGSWFDVIEASRIKSISTAFFMQERRGAGGV